MKKDITFVIFAFISIFINTPILFLNISIYCIAIIGLAYMLGNITSLISEFIGEKKGGLLSATFGNIPELIMGIWSIKYGMIIMAKSALIGSIISNMLLGLGVAIICGGLKHKEQNFNKIIARTNFNMLLLAMSAIIVIASLNRYAVLNKQMLTSISVKVSIILIIIYILGLIFSFYTHSNLFILCENEEDKSKKISKELIQNIVFLIIIIFLIYTFSEKLISNIKYIVDNFKISQGFIGFILIPLMGNIGEIMASIICALDNKINTSLEIAIGSSMQITLFVTPLLVIFSYCLGIYMNFLFTTFHIIMCIIAVAMSFFVFQDGKTYWLEGAILISIYFMVSLAYYYVA